MSAGNQGRKKEQAGSGLRHCLPIQKVMSLCVPVKDAPKGFLFLRRESVLPLCRAGPVCPAGTNAVFCGGTHGSRPTDRCGKPSVGDVEDAVPYTLCHCAPVRRLARQSVSPQRKGRIPEPVTVSLARNDSAAALQDPLCEGAVGAADRGREKPRNVSPSASASRCHLPRRGRLWSSAPLDKPTGMGIIINRRGRCDKRSAPLK